VIVVPSGKSVWQQQSQQSPKYMSVWSYSQVLCTNTQTFVTMATVAGQWL